LENAKQCIGYMESVLVSMFYSDSRKGYCLMPVKFCVHIGDKGTLNMLLTF